MFAPQPHMNRVYLEDIHGNTASPRKISIGIRKIERREWWLWTTAIIITLLLTIGNFVVCPALPPLQYCQV